MSQHHRRIKHTSKSPALRAKYGRMLPMPCTECGRPVMPDQTWHLAHLLGAEFDGQTTAANTGVAHAKCNLVAGGKRGAAVTNRRRRAESNADTGRRRWY